jgi:phage tail sheath protein FI
MPVTPTYPGVYIEELESGVRPIVGVATSITAFVGWSPFGPENVGVRIQSFGDYERRFGGLDAESELGFAVQQYFLNGGSDAIIVRVPRQGAAAASFTVNDSGGKAALKVTASSTGNWGDQVAVSVDTEGLSAEKGFNLTVSNLATGESERFVDLTTDPGSARFARVVINDEDTGSALIDLEPGEAADAKAPVASGTVGKDVGTLSPAGTKAHKLTVQPDLPGKADPNDATKWVPDTAAVEVTVLEKGETPPGSLAGWASLLERKINAALAASDKATYAGYRVSGGLSGSGKGLRLTGVSTRAGAVDAGFVIGKVTENANTGDAASLLGFDGSTASPGRYLAAGVARGPLAAPTKGNPGDKQPGTDQLIGNEGAFTGMQALRRVDLFNLLCLPDATRASAGDPSTQDSDVNADAVWAAGYDLCDERRAMLLIDPPPSVSTPERALDWISSGLGTKGPNAAAWFPRLRIPDATNGFRPRTVAPSATIAGLCARTDADQGVWKAPAGTEARLRNVTGLVRVLYDDENGQLNPLGLNSLRTFPIFGTVSWGARTTDGADALASQWKYVPVRRLALFLEESLYRGTQWAVFQPNDEPLWAQLRVNLTAFMHDLFRKGAFAGRTPREAYLVKCDAETTTPLDQDRGTVNVLVGFAPLKPAEFVIIRIKQLAGQTTT